MPQLVHQDAAEGRHGSGAGRLSALAPRRTHAGPPGHLGGPARLRASWRACAASSTSAPWRAPGQGIIDVTQTPNFPGAAGATPTGLGRPAALMRETGLLVHGLDVGLQFSW